MRACAQTACGRDTWHGAVVVIVTRGTHRDTWRARRPIWNGPIHDSEFLAKAIAHLKTDGKKLYAASPKASSEDPVFDLRNRDWPPVPLFDIGTGIGLPL